MTMMGKLARLFRLRTTGRHNLPLPVGKAPSPGTITFSAPQIQSGFLRFQMTSLEGADGIYFTVPDDFHAHPDCMAACLATLCGTRYSAIHFDFALSDRCSAAIAERTAAHVTARERCEPRQTGSLIALNFSGGFDSLAALHLAPDAVRTVAVDFGKHFTRERKFFETLNPDRICATDFREKGYDRHDWLFMGAVSLLFADYLDLDSIAFGTIFEATTYNYRLKPAGPVRIPLLESLGLHDATYTRGLTEFATAMIVDAYSPELIEPSIRSLASEGTEKSLRKRLLVDAVRHRNGGPAPDFDRYVYPRNKSVFGKSYAIDFLGLIFTKLYGSQAVSRWIDGLPPDIDHKLACIDVEWVFRLNPHFHAQMPDRLRESILARLSGAGVHDFREQDWAGYLEIRRKLAESHSFPERET
jgi:hypothetical protein